MSQYLVVPLRKARYNGFNARLFEVIAHAIVREAAAAEDKELRGNDKSLHPLYLLINRGLRGYMTQASLPPTHKLD